MQQIVTDVQSLLAAIGAKDYWTAFILGLKVAGEVAAQLTTRMGLRPHQAVSSLKLAPDITGLCSQLQAEVSKTLNTIDWSTVYLVLKAILTALSNGLFHGGPLP